MIEITVDYQKENEKIHFKKEVKSSVFRVEGKNGSGKTLLLETLARAFHLAPDAITDESLKRYYLSFISGEQKQTITFNIMCDFNGIIVKSEKTGPQVSTSINGELSSMMAVQNKFHVFFDSIKTPETQAKEYEIDCLAHINSLISDCDLFKSKISEIDKNNRDYLAAYKMIQHHTEKINSNTKELEQIEKKIKEIKDRKNEVANLITLWKIEDLTDEIERLNSQMEKIKAKLKGINEVKKRTKEVNSEFINARTGYLSMVKRIELDHVFIKYLDRNEANFLLDLKKITKKIELKIKLGKLNGLISKQKMSISDIENKPGYKNFRFLKAVGELLKEYNNEFTKMYPEFHKKILSDYNEFSALEGDIANINTFKTTLEEIYQIINAYLSVLDEAQELNMTDGDDDSRETLANNFESLNKTIESKMRELEKLKLIKIENTLSYKKYDYIKLEEEEKTNEFNLSSLERNKKDNELAKIRAIDAINEYEKISKIKPEYYEHIEEIDRLNKMFGNISGKLSNKVYPVLKKLEKASELLEDEKVISKGLGRFFGAYQNSIVHGSQLKLVKEIDFISKAFVLEDDSLIYFRTNTGHIIVNTLLGKVRNLPSDKKSILLIDEASPLDEDNRRFLEEELKKYVNEGKIFFAAIAIPGERYGDREVHIVEC